MRGRCGLVVLLAMLGCDTGPAECDRLIEPGDDASAAFAELRSGETVCFAPGTHVLTGSLEIAAVADVRLVGVGTSREDVVLDASSPSGSAAIVARRTTRLRIEHLRIDFGAGHGVFVADSFDLVLEDLELEGDGARGVNALYVFRSSRVLVEGCGIARAPDTGIDVDACAEVLVRGNVVRESLVGIDVGNSMHVELDANEVVGNSIGIALLETADDERAGAETLVRRNRLVESAGETGLVSIESVGLLIAGADRVEVRENEIRGNGTTGIAVVSWPTLEALGATSSVDPGFDGWIDDVWIHDSSARSRRDRTGARSADGRSRRGRADRWIHDNDFSDNGASPSSALGAIWSTSVAPREDVWFDAVAREGAAELELCVDDRGTFRAERLSATPEPITDRAAWRCDGAAVLPVER